MPSSEISHGGDSRGSVNIVGRGNSVQVSFGSELTLPLQRYQLGVADRRRKARRVLDVLVAQQRMVPMIGRADELAALQAWLDGPEDVSVHTIIGRAGSGKTRLAVEFCAAVDSAQAPGGTGGWVAGFIPTGSLPSLAQAFETRSYDWRGQMLLVIDYVASQHRALARWLDRLALEDLPEGAKLRLLLLEREAPEGFGWWEDLRHPKLNAGAARMDLFTGERPEPLYGLEKIEQRRRVVSEALAATEALAAPAAHGQGIPAAGADPAFDTRLQADQFANPLSLMMAGMIAQESLPNVALGLRRLEAAHRLGAREIKRLQDLAPDQPAAMAHAAAFNGLTGGLPVAEMRQSLHEELATMVLQGKPEALEGLLEQEFPPDLEADVEDAVTRLSTIQPDLIGEAAILAVLDRGTAGQKARAPEVMARAYAVTDRRAAEALMRLLQDYAYAREDSTASEAEKATAERLLGWLTSLAASIEDPEALEPLAFALPKHTLVLREAALELTARLAEAWSAVLATDEREGSAWTAYRAFVWISNHAARLAEVGAREDAQAQAQKAEQIARQLAEAAPDAFTPNLASSLNNLANFLSNLGQREAALSAAQEAVDLRRQLASARPDAFTPNLATSLNNLASFLSALGQREAALSAAQEAVDLYRQLASARPDAFTPDLAMSLNNLANRLSDLGQREAALSAAQEAVDLYRQLASARPDAFTPNLAMSLNNLANRLSDLGQREAALSAAQEAVDLYRQLASARPDAFTPDLAMSLNNLANRLSDLGQREAALSAAQEAVDLYRQLASARPDAFTPDLAMSLNNLASFLSDLDQREAALSAAQEAVDLRRQLASARPDAFTPDLATSLNNLANVLSDLGQREAALSAAQKAVDLYRQLASARPDAFTVDLSMSLGMFCDIQRAQGNPHAAFDATSEAIETLSPVFRQLPQAVAHWMQMHLQRYVELVKELGAEPDMELLGPIVEVFETLR